MSIVLNFPSISIMLCLFSGVITSALKKNAAKILNRILLFVNAGLSLSVLIYTLKTGTAYVYRMGNFPAPWGNELRFGSLEAVLALFFCIIMYLALLGGSDHLDTEVEERKHNLYYVLCSLLLSSLLALVYTNDIFTAYVFVEINTISACGLIMIRQVGRTIEAAIRYMIMSLIGSGMLLLGICMIYDLTGHLLMSNIHDSIQNLVATEGYTAPMIVAIAIISVGLAIKSALFPFHAWLPDAYGYSTVSSAAILSSLVSKGYIFLLIKIIYRVIGFDIYHDSGILNILYVFGLCGMIAGSVLAIREKDIRRMISFSSVAQIGYIYMGFGLGTTLGMIASIFHIFAHAVAKALLFISAIGLTDVSKGSRMFKELSGAGYRNKIAGLGFTIGSLSMVGIPLFPGFISKLLYAEAAVGTTGRMLPALICLAISTILNTVYFMNTVLRIYTPTEENDFGREYANEQKKLTVAIILFLIICLILGCFSQSIIDVIASGLTNEL